MWIVDNDKKHECQYTKLTLNEIVMVLCHARLALTATHIHQNSQVLTIHTFHEFYYLFLCERDASSSLPLALTHNWKEANTTKIPLTCEPKKKNEEENVVCCSCWRLNAPRIHMICCSLAGRLSPVATDYWNSIFATQIKFHLLCGPFFASIFGASCRMLSWLNL